MQLANKGGRPSIYDEALMEEFLDQLVETPIHELCKLDKYPSERTIFHWMSTNADFARRVARARDAGTERIAHQIATYADELRTGKDATGEKIDKPPASDVVAYANAYEKVAKIRNPRLFKDGPVTPPEIAAGEENAPERQRRLFDTLSPSAKERIRQIIDEDMASGEPLQIEHKDEDDDVD